MTRHVFDIIVQVALCMQSFSQEWQNSIKRSTGEVFAVCSGDISLKVCQVLTMKEEVTTTCQSLQRQTSHGHLPVHESSDVKQASSLWYADGILSDVRTFVPSARRHCSGQHSA